MKRVYLISWWLLILTIFATGTFFMIVNFDNKNAVDLEEGRFHSAVITLSITGEDQQFGFMDPVDFYESHTRAEQAWEHRKQLTIKGTVFPAGAVKNVSSKVTTHMAYPHYQLSRDWAENIDPCTCRQRVHVSLLQRFRGGLAALGVGSGHHPALPDQSITTAMGPGGR